MHRVVDHKLGRNQRLDCGGIATERDDGVAHRREVDDRRDAGEILHQHACRAEGDLDARLSAGVPASERLNVGRRDVAFAFVAEKVLEQNLQRKRQPRDVESLA